MSKFVGRVMVMVLLSAGCLAAELPLVTGGQPAATIVVADQPAAIPIKDTTVRFAAELIRDCLRQATGAELPIVSLAELGDRPGTLIVLGDTPRTRQAGLDPAALPPEGYLIRTVANTVYLVGEVSPEGTDRGTAFAAFEFLERVAGVRWYFPGELGTVVPEAKTLAIPALEVANSPRFAVRYGGISHWKPDIAREWYPALRFGIREGLVANHTEEGWHEIYGKEHPEYFGLRADGTRAITADRHRSGQNRSYLCYSEPGVLNQYLQNIDGFFATGDLKPWRGAAARPTGTLIPFMPSDVRDICVCPTCQAETDLDRGKWGRGSNLILGFTRRLGEELAKRHPNATLWGSAYDHYQLLPTRVNSLPDNVAITLCLIPTIVQMNHQGVRDRNRALIDGWLKLVHDNPRHLIVWDYFCYPNFFFTAPTECSSALQEHIRYLDGRALGIFNNGFNPETRPGPQCFLTYRIVWLMHRLLWNPNLDLDQARRDWTRDLYGPAGDTMDAFYALLEQRWRDITWSVEPKVGYVGENSLYGETYPPDVIDRLDHLLTVAESQAPPDSLHRRRLDWLRSDQFATFFREARAFHTSMGAVPVYRARKPAAAPAIDGLLADAEWAPASHARLGEHRLGGSVPEISTVRLLHDGQTLYVGASLEKLQPEAAVAAARGRENPAVEQDDMFIVHLASPGAEGYVELAVNPAGAFSSQAKPIEARGYFPTHPPVAWDTARVQVASKLDDHLWTVELAIPLDAIPGMTPNADRLRLELIRWDKAYRHLFHCWSPLLSSWDYPLARFGWLELGDAPTRSLILPAGPGQAGYLGATGAKPDQPAAVTESPKLDKGLIIVGQRDLNEKTWLELRGLVVIDLQPLADTALVKATLQLEHLNAVEAAPWDAVVVDHLASPTGAIAGDDFARAPLRARLGVLLPPERAGQRGICKLDVTDCLLQDLAAGRRYAAFRLRPADGTTAADGKTHYLIFRGQGAAEGQPPAIEAIVATP